MIHTHLAACGTLAPTVHSFCAVLYSPLRQVLVAAGDLKDVSRAGASFAVWPQLLKLSATLLKPPGCIVPSPSSRRAKAE